MEEMAKRDGGEQWSETVERRGSPEGGGGGREQEWGKEQAGMKE